MRLPLTQSTHICSRGGSGMQDILSNRARLVRDVVVLQCCRAPTSLGAVLSPFRHALILARTTKRGSLSSPTSQTQAIPLPPRSQPFLHAQRDRSNRISSHISSPRLASLRDSLSPPASKRPSPTPTPLFLPHQTIHASARYCTSPRKVCARVRKKKRVRWLGLGGRRMRERTGGDDARGSVWEV